MNKFIQDNLVTILEAARVALTDVRSFDRLAEELDFPEDYLREIRDGLEDYLNETNK